MTVRCIRNVYVWHDVHIIRDVLQEFSVHHLHVEHITQKLYAGRTNRANDIGADRGISDRHTAVAANVADRLEQHGHIRRLQHGRQAGKGGGDIGYHCFMAVFTPEIGAAIRREMVWEQDQRITLQILGDFDGFFDPVDILAAVLTVAERPVARAAEGTHFDAQMLTGRLEFCKILVLPAPELNGLETGSVDAFDLFTDIHAGIQHFNIDCKVNHTNTSCCFAFCFLPRRQER